MHSTSSDRLSRESYPFSNIYVCHSFRIVKASLLVTGGRHIMSGYMANPRHGQFRREASSAHCDVGVQATD